MKKAGGVPVKPKLTGVSREWPPLWIPLHWTDSGSEPEAGEFGRGGFCAGRTERAGEERTSSAPGFGEDAVCCRRPRWSPVCDTIALLAPCTGSGERSAGEWMPRFPPAASWLRRQHSAKQGVKTGNKNMACAQQCPSCFCKMCFTLNGKQ